MPSSVILLRTDVSEERIASIIRMTRIGELRTLAEMSNRSTLRRNTTYVYHRLLTWWFDAHQ
jgi:hypothetical protein